jgi:CRISPR-associated protein Cas2
MARRRYLITYDIVADRRRERVHRALLDAGDHIQYSVFLCDLDDRERVKLRGRLDELIHHAEDQILTIDLGLADREVDQLIASLGRDFALPCRVVVV